MKAHGKALPCRVFLEYEYSKTEILCKSEFNAGNCRVGKRVSFVGFARLQYRRF